MEAEGGQVMGHIQFMNQDGEWESFPTPEEEVNLRANAAYIVTGKQIGRAHV